MRNYILLFIGVITFYSCSDNVGMKETDLKKYPWLTSFLISEIKDFEGTHNIDIGTMRFSYAIPIKSKNGILVKIDSVAKNENWSLISSSVIGKEYSKMLNQLQADTEQTFVKIEIDTIENRIRFNIK